MFQSVLSPKVDMHPLILTNDNTGREADHLFSISEPIACKDANPFEAFSGPWCMVKKLMRPRTCSISGAPQAVRDTESGLHVLCCG